MKDIHSKMGGHPRVNRRDFLRGTTGLLAAGMIPGCGRVHQADKSSSSLAGLPGKRTIPPVLPGYQPEVVSSWIPRNEHESSSNIFKKTIEATTDFSWLSRGDRVLLKLALNSGNPYPATTDPWALWSLVKLLQEKGAGEIIVGDQSGMESVRWFRDSRHGSSRELCKSAGLLKIIEESGARPYFFEERGYDSYLATSPAGNNHWQDPIQITSLVKEVDHIIYLTRVSSHVMSDITSGFKIGVGFLREDSRRAFHRGGENFYAMHEEINAVPEISSKLRLILSSGRSVLSTLGPDNGHVTHPEYGLLIASNDLLAHELLSYAWLNWNRQFETPAYSRATTGSLTRWRAQINQLFLWWAWKSHRGEETPAIPLWQPGNIYQHPAIVNYMIRNGGRPETIAWEQINRGPEQAVTDFLSENIWSRTSLVQA